MTKTSTSKFVILSLSMALSSSGFAAEGHGLFGIFKRKRPAPSTQPAPPVQYPNYGNYTYRPDFLPSPWLETTDREWRPVVQGTVDSMNQAIEDHYGGIERTGVGSMFGPKSAYAKLTPEQQEAWLQANTKPGALVKKKPQRTSCVDFVLTQLKAGYARAGKLDRFNELKNIVVAHNGQGAVLLQELQKDGWTMVYWNPDEKNPSTAIRNETDTQGNHRPSHHTWTASTVKNQGWYLKGVDLMTTEEHAELQARFPNIPINKKFPGLPVDPQNTVTNFRPTNPYQTAPNYNDLQKLYNAPMFVGIANGGYHVYAGTHGKIVESHSTRNPNDPTNLEVRDFSSWGVKPDEGFGSGVIAVPPGSWGR